MTFDPHDFNDLSDLHGVLADSQRVRQGDETNRLIARTNALIEKQTAAQIPTVPCPFCQKGIPKPSRTHGQAELCGDCGKPLAWAEPDRPCKPEDEHRIKRGLAEEKKRAIKEKLERVETQRIRQEAYSKNVIEPNKRRIAERERQKEEERQAQERARSHRDEELAAEAHEQDEASRGAWMWGVAPLFGLVSGGSLAALGMVLDWPLLPASFVGSAIICRMWYICHRDIRREWERNVTDLGVYLSWRNSFRSEKRGFRHFLRDMVSWPRRLGLPGTCIIGLVVVLLFWDSGPVFHRVFLALPALLVLWVAVEPKEKWSLPTVGPDRQSLPSVDPLEKHTGTVGPDRQSLPSVDPLEIFFKAMCCVAIADGRVVRTEKRRIIGIMEQRNWPGDTDTALDNLLSEFKSKIRASSWPEVLDGVVSEAGRFAAQSSGQKHFESVVGHFLRMLEIVADSDGVSDKAEMTIIKRFRDVWTT